MSATAVALVGLCRAACIVLVDASGNFVDDLLNSWVGRIGEWLVLGAVMTAYAVHLRRQACGHCAVAAAPVRPRIRARRTLCPPTPTRAGRRLVRPARHARATSVRMHRGM
jgi:hypothetical protein